MQGGDDDHQGGVTDAKYFPLMLNIFYSGGDGEQVPGSSSQQRLSSSRMYKLWSGNNRDQLEHQPPRRQESGTVLWSFCQQGNDGAGLSGVIMGEYCQIFHEGRRKFLGRFQFVNLLF